MVSPPDSLQPIYVPPPLDEIPDVDEDKPADGRQVKSVGTQHLPNLIYGAGTLAPFYNEDGFLNSDGPLRAIRLALRYGITAFDTSPYYGPSEIILGAILRSLGAEFPRTSYQLMTKAGRYGGDHTKFDYSPATVRASVLRSLSRLGTDHLDTVYLHDVEFVATPVREGSTAGDPRMALEDPDSWGLKEGEEGRIRGEGDQRVLVALRELWKMKEEGMIQAIGISGYPLPTLLRLALLFLHNPPYKPLDILLSYSHHNLQNSTFPAFLQPFLHRAKIAQLVNASPFSMGLLTLNHPAWHPAPAGLIVAKDEAATAQPTRDWPGGLPNLALGFSLRPLEGGEEGQEEMWGVPCVVGLSTTREVHEAVSVWREVQGGAGGERRLREEAVRTVFRSGGWDGISWQSPPLP